MDAMRPRGIAAVVLLVWLTPGVAAAHSIGPRFVPVYDGMEPSRPGVKLEPQATGAMPRVTLTVAGRHTVEVTGTFGEPFLRVGTDGASVNTSSPAAPLLARETKLPQHATPREPVWKRRSSSPSIAWYEPRAEYPYNDAPEVVRKRKKRATVHRWSIPALYDGQPVQLRGHVDWVPQPLDPTAFVLFGLVVFGAVFIAITGRVKKRA